MRTLWSILLSYVPKPEVVEIEHLIGKKLIDHNEVSHPVLILSDSSSLPLSDLSLSLSL
jgi:hypothetical protein